MLRSLAYLLFAVIAVALLAAGHYYLWARLVRDPGWPQPWRFAGGLALVVLGIATPLGMMLGRIPATTLGRAVAWVGSMWMGVLFLLVVLLGAVDLVRLVVLGTQTVAAATGAPLALPTDPSRRELVWRVLAGGIALTALGAARAGVRTASLRPEIMRVRVGLTRLPEKLAGATIVQLSDLHLGPTLGREWLADVVAAVNELSPDVVVITGDLVDGSVAELRDTVAPLASLCARWGVYFVTGNHEYYSGLEEWMPELARLGIRVLRNERVSVGEGDASFDLAGVDDHSAGRFGGGPDFARAFAGRDPGRELVLLAHQPKAIYEAAAAGAGLQLSGHTHGGQIWPWGYLVRLTQPYLRGLARHGPTQIYVSCGTGYWGPPMRLGARPEITLVELGRA